MLLTALHMISSYPKYMSMLKAGNSKKMCDNKTKKSVFYFNEVSKQNFAL